MSSDAPLNVKTLLNLSYNRSKKWTEFLNEITELDDNEEFERDELPVLFEREDINTDSLSDMEDPFAIDSDTENMDVQNINKKYFTRQTKNVLTANVMHCEPLDDDIQDIFNQTQMALVETGMDRIFNTFDMEKIEDKVGGWLRHTKAIDVAGAPTSPIQMKAYPAKTDHSEEVNDTDSASLNSGETARYILSNRKRSLLRVPAHKKMTIKKFRMVQSKRDALREKYACLNSDEELRCQRLGSHSHSYVHRQAQYSHNHKCLYVRQSYKKTNRYACREYACSCQCMAIDSDSSDATVKFHNSSCLIRYDCSGEMKASVSSKCSLRGKTKIDCVHSDCCQRVAAIRKNNGCNIVRCSHKRKDRPCHSQLKSYKTHKHLVETSNEEWIVEELSSVSSSSTEWEEQESEATKFQRKISHAKAIMPKSDCCPLTVSKTRSIIGPKPKVVRAIDKGELQVSSKLDNHPRYKSLPTSIQKNKETDRKVSSNIIEISDCEELKPQKRAGEKSQKEMDSPEISFFSNLKPSCNSTELCKYNSGQNSRKLSETESDSDYIESLKPPRRLLRKTVHKAKKGQKTDKSNGSPVKELKRRAQPVQKSHEKMVKSPRRNPKSKISPKTNNESFDEAEQLKIAIKLSQQTYKNELKSKKSKKLLECKEVSNSGLVTPFCKPSVECMNVENESKTLECAEIEFPPTLNNSCIIIKERTHEKCQKLNDQSMVSEKSEKPSSSKSVQKLLSTITKTYVEANHDEGNRNQQRARYNIKTRTALSPDSSKPIVINHSSSDDSLCVTSTTSDKLFEQQTSKVGHTMSPTSKRVLLYSSEQSESGLLVDGLFTVKEELLSSLIGKQAAKRFFKYYIGRKTFDKRSTVYYVPPENSNWSSDSEADFLDFKHYAGTLVELKKGE